ncbi:MAG: iron chelate uptake ABC transporter family permease subunit [Rickettsiales bacterium]|nr:iron chelate uptake ABC transporter family permease subunit [Rickettsiales bacterium]
MFDAVMFDFFIHALLAGIMLAIATAPLGCFVVWRKMAYFGDAIAHSALLGVVMGLLWQIPLIFAILPIALSIGLILGFAHEKSRFSSDTLLGILAHGGLALGVTIMAMTPSLQVDLMAYLFGDILAVTADDLVAIYILASFVLFILWFRWREFLLVTMNEELATVQGINTRYYRIGLMLLVALTVAISIKLVGLLLITSLLILPAATARFFSKNPAQMAILATCIALVMVIGGLFASLTWDTPSGPSIVLTGTVLFAVLAAITRFKRKSLASS